MRKTNKSKFYNKVVFCDQKTLQVKKHNLGTLCFLITCYLIIFMAMEKEK